jgi:hypothetical protein
LGKQSFEAIYSKYFWQETAQNLENVLNLSGLDLFFAPLI